MKISKIALLAFVVLLTSSCAEKPKDNDFIIDSKNSATALTIGWYAPVDVLKEIVGSRFVPKVVNDKNESSVMLFIVKSNEHIVDGFSSGPMEAAHIVIPVVANDNLLASDGSKIENHIVCPITIVDQSQRLGNKYKEFGFATYSGKIDMDVSQSEEKYLVEVKMETVNGLIEISGMFEKEGEHSEITSAIFSTNTDKISYFYGSERMTRYSDGKGSLNTGGQNIIKAMNLSGHPYFLKLDMDFTWEFDFANAQP